MTKNIYFTQAQQDDLPIVLQFLKEAALWLQERGIDYWQDWLHPPPLFLNWIQQGFDRDEFYLVYQNADVIGCFRLQWQDELFWGPQADNAGYIHSFTISRSLAGQHKGERVLTLIEEYCRTLGKTFLRLDCGKEIHSLCQYYEGYGFRKVGEITVMGEEMVLYEKPLVVQPRPSWNAVAIDLDGTLLNSNRSIGQHSLEMIREATRQGWTIIISTARPVRAIRLVVPEWFEDFYWAACNGAWILKGGQMLRRIEVPHEIALYWIEVLSRHGLYFLIEADDKLFTDQQMLDDFVGECSSLNQLSEGGVCKVLVRPRSQEQVKVVRSLMPAECAYVVTDGGELVQIAHKECNKLRAVEYILGRERIELDKVIAFGDDNNDIQLVMGAGCGVAMDNATDELKEVADHITVTNDKDGVGEFLRGVLFG